jgi:threonine/homoserine/homoserine lactone efflux protein
MITSQVLTAITLGFIAGAIPGPIIFLAFSEILRSPRQNFLTTSRYVYLAGITELFIGLFLVTTSSLISIPDFIFPGLSMLGGLLLVYLGFQTKQAYKSYQHNIEIKPLSSTAIVVLMLLNGPLWLFWLSVNLPNAFLMGKSIFLGKYLFVCIFEIGMMSSMSILLFLFKSFRRIFSNTKLLKLLYLVLALALVFFGIKLLYSGALFFLHN